MKILVVGFVAIVVSLAFRFKEEKKLKLEFTGKEWEARYNWLEIAKQQIRRSDIPAKDALFVCDSLLGRFQSEMVAQLQPQFTADSTSKKPNKK